MNKKKIILCLSALAIVGTITTGCGKQAKLKTEENTVVSFKKGKITANDLYKELKKDSVEKLINMIDHKLFDKKYPSDDTEEKQVENQLKQIKTYYGSDESTYKSALKTYFGVETEDEAKELLSLEYKRGLAVNDYLEDNITDEEIQKYYDENIYPDIKASHILISVDTTDKMSDDEKKKAKSSALKKAKEVISKLEKEEKFEDLAKKYSTDKDTASNGGSLGYINSDDMDASFWNSLKDLKKGEYTKEPVETSYGYEIIKNEGEKKKASLKSKKSSIKKTLAKEKLSNDSSLYYKSLIEIRKSKNITFGDSELEKDYNDYMDTLIENATKNQSSSNSNQ